MINAYAATLSIKSAHLSFLKDKSKDLVTKVACKVMRMRGVVHFRVQNDACTYTIWWRISSLVIALVVYDKLTSENPPYKKWSFTICFVVQY